MMSTPRLSGMGQRESALVTTCAFVAVLIMIAPIIAVIAMSFTASATAQFPPPGLSLRWYGAAWNLMFGPDADINRLREAIITSLTIGVASAAICLVAGLPAAYVLERFRFPGKSIVEGMVDLPIVFPTVVLGVALLIIVSRLPFDPGIGQIVIAHSIIGVPFMIRNVAGPLRRLDPSLQEAARTLGASPWRAFMAIVLPAIRGGIISGLTLVFVLSFNEFTLTYFLSTVDVFPLSIWLFQRSNTIVDPSIFSVSSIIILVNVLIILLLDRLSGGASKQ